MFKICGPWSYDTNSTLRSVVPLAMFFPKCTEGGPPVWEIFLKKYHIFLGGFPYISLWHKIAQHFICKRTIICTVQRAFGKLYPLTSYIWGLQSSDWTLFAFSREICSNTFDLMPRGYWVQPSMLEHESKWTTCTLWRKRTTAYPFDLPENSCHSWYHNG